MSGAKKWLGLAGWMAVPLLVGMLASQVDAGSRYGTLTRPPLAPPSWLFGPVWTVLYLAMGVAAWLVWKEGGFGRAGAALGVFLAQLVPYLLWVSFAAALNFALWRLNA